jgi:hypothetical protein
MCNRFGGCSDRAETWCNRYVRAVAHFRLIFIKGPGPRRLGLLAGYRPLRDSQPVTAALPLAGCLLAVWVPVADAEPLRAGPRGPHGPFPASGRNYLGSAHAINRRAPTTPSEPSSVRRAGGPYLTVLACRPRRGASVLPVAELGGMARAPQISCTFWPWAFNEY